MKKRIFALLLTAAICVTAFAGCGNDGGNSSSKEDSKPASSTGSTVTAEKDPYGADFTSYPLDGSESLTFYVLAGYGAPDGVDYADNEWQKGLSERTGININWKTAPAGSDASQAFNLMIAGNDLPDIFYYSGLTSQATQLIEDGKIVSLNDYIETYAPAYYKFVTSDKTMNNSVKNDNGDYYGFAFLREDQLLGSYSGPVVRKDLLDQLDKDIPTTIDEWTDVLTAMKDTVKYPFSVRWRLVDLFCPFSGAFKTTNGFYVEDGKVHYGYAEAGMKDFLTTMNEWYEAGLIDPDFLSNDNAALETKVLNGEVGSMLTTGGTLAGYKTKLNEINSTDVWAAAPYPTQNKGETPWYIQGETPNIGIIGAITTACKNVPLACRFFDYGYTKEGAIYYNFGKEDNYTMVDGEPAFTEAFTSDPRGLDTMKKTYTAMYGNAPTLSLMASFNSQPQFQKDCINTWYNKDGLAHLMPGALTMTTEESTSIATEATAIDAQASEMVTKFIVGQESLDNWDSFVATLNSLGLEHVLEVRQAAYDRFLAR